MKYALIAFGVVCVAGAAFLIFKEAPQAKEPAQQLPAPTVTIIMRDDGYSTSTVALKEGDVVAFVNEGSTDRWPASDLHPTHEIYSDLDPRGPVAPGATWSFEFARCGMWRFHDHLKPSIRGMIEVACTRR